MPPLVDSPTNGAADALYSLGSALTRREDELSLANRGLAYLQLSLYLNPTQQLAMLSLADLYEAMKKPEMAVKVYDTLAGGLAAQARRRNSVGHQSRLARSH